jgi:hypothetical protein
MISLGVVVPNDKLGLEVHRKIGDYLTVEASLQFVAKYVGQGEILMADRDFTGFVVVATNGVATGWSTKG